MKTTLSFSGLAKSSVLLLGLFLAQTNFAATCIWTGAGGDWDNANNWSTHAVPVAGDKAYIPTTPLFPSTWPVISPLPALPLAEHPARLP